MRHDSSCILQPDTRPVEQLSDPDAWRERSASRGRHPAERRSRPGRRSMSSDRDVRLPSTAPCPGTPVGELSITPALATEQQTALGGAPGRGVVLRFGWLARPGYRNDQPRATPGATHTDAGRALLSAYRYPVVPTTFAARGVSQTSASPGPSDGIQSRRFQQIAHRANSSRVLHFAVSASLATPRCQRLGCGDSEPWSRLDSRCRNDERQRGQRARLRDTRARRLTRCSRLACGSRGAPTCPSLAGAEATTTWADGAHCGAGTAGPPAATPETPTTPPEPQRSDGHTIGSGRFVRLRRRTATASLSTPGRRVSLGHSSRRRPRDPARARSRSPEARECLPKDRADRVPIGLAERRDMRQFMADVNGGWTSFDCRRCRRSLS
jgi:hypothetical protein